MASTPLFIFIQKYSTMIYAANVAEHLKQPNAIKLKQEADLFWENNPQFHEEYNQYNKEVNEILKQRNKEVQI